MPNHPKILIDDVTGDIVNSPEDLTNGGGRYLDGELAQKYIEEQQKKRAPAANKARDKAAENK